MKRQKINLDYNRKVLLNNITLEQTYSASPKAKIKAKVILLKSEGNSIKEIMKETKLSKRTIVSYISDYNNPNKNIGGLRFIHKKNYKISVLEKIHATLLEEFKLHPPISYKEASERINKLFNIIISESATRAYLNKNSIYTKRSKKPIRNINTESKKENDRN